MTHRFTLDYADDYAFVAAVYEALWQRRSGRSSRWPRSSRCSRSGPTCAR